MSFSPLWAAPATQARSAAGNSALQLSRDRRHLDRRVPLGLGVERGYRGRVGAIAAWKRLVASMLRREVQHRTDGKDARRIDVPVAPIVVRLILVNGDRARDSRNLVQLARVAPQRRIIDEAAHVALEVAVINRVKADQRGEQAPVGFRNEVAQQVTLAAQPLLQPVEGLENLARGGLVG